MLFTWIDWVIVAIIFISTLMGLLRGLIKEALSLGIWVVAGMLAWTFGTPLSVYMATYIETPSLQILGASVLIFVTCLLLGALVQFLLAELVRATGLSSTDRLLGMVFGSVRGALLVAVLVWLLSLTVVAQDIWWQESLLVPTFLEVAEGIKAFLGELTGFSEKHLPGAALSVP